MPSSAHDSEGESLEAVTHRLTDFAATYPHLPLYSRIARAASVDAEVASLLTAARPGQARPVLLLAALHDLVLRSPGVPAARWFAAAPDLDGDPWPDVRDTVLAHADDLRAVVASRSTQTNEVNRCVYVAALLAAAGRDLDPAVPVALVELGASAGLLLGLDRYRIEVGSTVFGDPASPVRCAGELRAGALAGTSLPPIVERVGLDRSPVPLSDPDGVRWLEACLWPDQPERLERFRAAVGRLRPDPPLLVAGDMVDDLAAVAHSARAVAAAAAGTPEVHLVVMSAWALTYVRRDRRPLVADALAELAAEGRPVSWITAEPPDAAPGLPPVDADDLPPGAETVLGLRRWRVGHEREPEVVGLAHPHAAHLHLE